jgi:hypothetical protein
VAPHTAAGMINKFSSGTMLPSSAALPKPNVVKRSVAMQRRTCVKL